MTYRSLNDIDWPCWIPQQRATLMFIVRAGRLLLIHKKLGLGAGKINGVGGRLEAGETDLEAAVRETEEELRIRPLNPWWCGRLSFQFTDGLSLRVSVFSAADYEGTPEETIEAIPFWFDLDDIPYDRMWQDDPHWLPFVLDGTRFDGYFLFDRDRMLDCRVDAPVPEHSPFRQSRPALGPGEAGAT